MEMLEMINTVDAGNKVGEVRIALHSNNEWNNQILTILMKYNNVYCIRVIDYND